MFLPFQKRGNSQYPVQSEENSFQWGSRENQQHTEIERYWKIPHYKYLVVCFCLFYSSNTDYKNHRYIIITYYCFQLDFHISSYNCI